MNKERKRLEEDTRTCISLGVVIVGIPLIILIGILVSWVLGIPVKF